MTVTDKVQLTESQERVLFGVHEGLTHGQIAARLGIAERTVKAYIELLRKKFGDARGEPVKTGRELIPIAHEYFRAQGL